MKSHSGFRSLAALSGHKIVKAAHTGLAAVRAIKVGEKASSHKSQDIPRTTANETLEILNQYIEEQASLTIGYADTNGGVSNRLIDPISISLGTLNARDHASGQVVPFKISRITGVSLAK